MTHLCFALVLVLALFAPCAAMAQTATPQESDGRVTAMSFEQNALTPPLDVAAVRVIDGGSPEEADSARNVRGIWKPFSPLTILKQIIFGAMGTALGGVIGFSLESWTALLLGAPAGMAFGVLLGGVSGEGPGGVGAFLASFAGSITGYLVCVRLQRSLNVNEVTNDSVLISVVASLTTSILFYNLIPVSDGEARIDTPPPAQTRNRNSIPDTWRDNTLYSVPVLPPDMWLVPVLTLRF